jgi:hypothetical protein
LLGVSALLLVAPALAYTIYMFWDPDPILAQEALHILVNFRNPQHALISSWLNWTVPVQVLVLLTGLWIIRKTRLFPILLIVTAAVLALTLLQVLTASKWLAMIFPWRASVLLVPMGTTILVAALVNRVMDGLKKWPGAERRVILFSLLVMIGLMAVGVIRFQVESARKLADPARPMMDFVAANPSPGQVYMVPSKMEDFRLVTGAPILVDFKSTPDRDEDVMEWYERLQRVSWFYNGTDDPCKLLDDIASQYGVTRVVVPRNIGTRVCGSLPVVYEDAS